MCNIDRRNKVKALSDKKKRNKKCIGDSIVREKFAFKAAREIVISLNARDPHHRRRAYDPPCVRSIVFANVYTYALLCSGNCAHKANCNQLNKHL